MPRPKLAGVHVTRYQPEDCACRGKHKHRPGYDEYCAVQGCTCSGPPEPPASDGAEPRDELHRLVDEIVMAPGWREALRAAVAAAGRENAELRNSLEACRNAGESIRTERGECWAQLADLRAEVERLRRLADDWSAVAVALSAALDA